MADLSNIFKVVNRFLFSKGQPSGMFTDTPISQQPKGTVHNAWGVDKQNTEEKGGGYYNANGMDLHSKVPEGYVPRGRHFVEDAEKMVIFSYNEGTTTSEIGYIDHKTGEYHKVIDDNDIEGCDLDFGMNEYIPIVSKYMKDGNCYDVHIYWTNGSYYKKLNIDNPCPPIDCDDIYLLKCSAVPTPTSYKSENGGRDLESGVYQYLGRYEDVDNNTTNWFQINAPVSIESPNNIAGEKSDESIYVKFSNLSVEYNILQIAVIKTIDGHTSAHMLSKKYYNTNSIEFVHRSPTQEMYEIPIEEILLKKNGYFRGYDLFQHDGRLFPYNILGEANEQWREMVDGIEVYYNIIGVPLKDAHKYKGLRADEVYSIAIKGKYCDGTTTRNFHIKGREAEASDREVVSPGPENCLDCEKERWEVENTAERLELFCEDPKEIGKEGEDIKYDNDLPEYEENPTGNDEPLGEDETNLPDEKELDDIMGKSKRQMECICQNLAMVHAAFVIFIKFGLFIAPSLRLKKRYQVLGNPVAIAQSYCMCQELAREGEPTDTGNDGGTNPGG